MQLLTSALNSNYVLPNRKGNDMYALIVFVTGTVLALVTGWLTVFFVGLVIAWVLWGLWSCSIDEVVKPMRKCDPLRELERTPLTRFLIKYATFRIIDTNASSTVGIKFPWTGWFKLETYANATQAERCVEELHKAINQFLSESIVNRVRVFKRTVDSNDTTS